MLVLCAKKPTYGGALRELEENSELGRERGL